MNVCLCFDELIGLIRMLVFIGIECMNFMLLLWMYIVCCGVFVGIVKLVCVLLLSFRLRFVGVMCMVVIVSFRCGGGISLLIVIMRLLLVSCVIGVCIFSRLVIFMLVVCIIGCVLIFDMCMLVGWNMSWLLLWIVSVLVSENGI